MMRRRLFPAMSGGAGAVAVPWHLAGGVPESTDYTIYDPLAAADLDTSYLNLANPGTRNAAPGVAPTFAAGQGWTFNGTTQYLTTGAPVGPNYTLLVWVEAVVNNTGYATSVFAFSPTRQFSIRPDVGNQVRYERGDSGSSSAAPDLPGGVLCIAGNKAYRNGVDEGLTLNAWTGANTSIGLYIGAQNQNGTPVTFYNGRVLRYALYNITLTEAEVQAVTDAMLTPPGGYALNAYAAQVLSLSPLAYWPMNETIGSYFKDHTGHRRFGMARNQTNDQAGKYGKAIKFSGTSTSKVNSGKNFTGAGGLDLDEYSVVFWVNLNVNVALQVRLANAYASSETEYSTLEVRTGDATGIFMRESGVNQTISSELLPVFADEAWVHIVFYNSLSAGKVGLYYNGTKYEFSRTLAGFAGTLDNSYPEMFMLLDGYAQHVAWFDRVLSQAEVDSLQ